MHALVVARRPAPWCEPLNPVWPAAPRVVVLGQERTGLSRFGEVCQLDVADGLMRAGGQDGEDYFHLMESPTIDQRNYAYIKTVEDSKVKRRASSTLLRCAILLTR